MQACGEAQQEVCLEKLMVLRGLGTNVDCLRLSLMLCLKVLCCSGRSRAFGGSTQPGTASQIDSHPPWMLYLFDHSNPPPSPVNLLVLSFKPDFVAACADKHG